jgi:hypothetical protein
MIAFTIFLGIVLGIIFTVLGSFWFKEYDRKQKGITGVVEETLVEAFKVMNQHIPNVRSIQGECKDGKWQLFAKCLKCGKSNRLRKADMVRVVDAGCGNCHAKFNEGSLATDEPVKNFFWN